MTQPIAIQGPLSWGLLLLFSAVSAQGGLSTPPTFSKVFTPDTIGPGSVSTLTFTITNGNPDPITGMAFTDTLPAGVTIADPAVASSDCDEAVLSAPDGGSTITFSDARLAGGASCTVSVNVTSSTPGTHMNTSSVLSSTAPDSETATDDLTVATDRPGFSKAFAPSTLPLGDRSTLTFTVDNSANGSLASSLAFTDNLPDGMVIADPARASHDCVTGFLTGGVLTATPGTGVVSLSFGEGADVAAVGAGGTCTVTVDVRASGAGTLDNVTGELSSFFSQSATSGKASATLDVTVTQIALQKSFTDDPVPPGGNVTLDFRVDNFDRIFAASSVAFSDDLNATLTGLLFDSLLANDCGGSVTGVGTTTIGLTGGSLGPEGSCTVSASLSVPPGAAVGPAVNTTGAISAEINGEGVIGNQASDTLFVEPAPILTKEFLDATTMAPDPIVTAEDDIILRFTIDNTSTTSMATDIAFLDELTTFLPSPVMAMLPTTPCGPGSSIVLETFLTDRQRLSLTGGSLESSGMPDDSCTFDITLSLPSGFPAGVYLNTTQEVTATVDGITATGVPASDDFTVVAAPRLTKEFTDDPAAPGDTVTLEFTLDHDAAAPGSASGVTFTDDLAATLAGLAATGLPLTDVCGMGNGSLTGSMGNTLLTFSGATLNAGELCTFSVVLDVPGDAIAGDYPNTTSAVSATVLATPATADPASDDLIVAGLLLSKEFLDDPSIPGDTVTLRFTVDNVHPTDDAINIGFSDDLNDVLPGSPDLTVSGGLPMSPCGGTLDDFGGLLVLSSASLNSGLSCFFDVTLLVPAGAPEGSFVNLTSSVTATLGGESFTGDPALDVLTVNANLIQLTKEFTDDPVAPGGSVNLRFTLTNLDATQGVSSIAFSDDLDAALSGLAATGLPLSACGGTVDAIPDASTIDFSGGSLGAGAQCSFDVSVAVPGGAAADSYTNTTSGVSGTIGGFGVTGDAASDELVVVNLLNFTKSFDGPTTATGSAVLTFTIANPGTSSVDQLSFSDDLSAVIPGLVATNLPLMGICGPGSMLSGSSFLTFAGGSLPAMGGMCSFNVDVAVPGTATAGTFPNATSELFQAGLPVAAPATAGLVVEPPPTFTKVFVPDSIGVGTVSNLTFLINNSASSLDASGLAFTDNLPAGVEIATPSVTSNSCGGTLTATAGASVITLTGGTVAAGSTCPLQVEVAPTSPGVFVNTSGDLTSSSGNSGPASDTLTANPQPGFSKSFAPNPILVNGTSTLTFTIDNGASTVAASNLDFTDNLPSAVTVANPANAATTCTGGFLTALSGTGAIDYTAGSVAAGASCTVTVDVTSDAVGMHANTSGDLTSSLGNSGAASDTLTAEDNEPPVVTAVATSIGPLAACDNLRTPIAQIDVTITDELTPVLNAGDESNFLLVGAGPDGDFTTAGCSGGAVGDDVPIEIVSLSLTGMDPLVVTSELGLGAALAPGLYRLLVCDEITDSGPNSLDGDGDMSAGGDFVISVFRADPFNLFANGHFDDCPVVTLVPWALATTPPNVIQPGTPGTDDSESSLLSASAQVQQSVAGSSAVGQCVAVDESLIYSLNSRLRFDAPMGALGVFTRSCEFFAASACTGASLGSPTIASVVEDEGGLWLFLQDQVTAPAGAVSALCDFTVGPLGGDPSFDAFFDGLFIGNDGAIFADGFESGNTAAWSSSVP